MIIDQQCHCTIVDGLKGWIFLTFMLLSECHVWRKKKFKWLVRSNHYCTTLDGLRGSVRVTYSRKRPRLWGQVQNPGVTIPYFSIWFSIFRINLLLSSPQSYFHQVYRKWTILFGGCRLVWDWCKCRFSKIPLTTLF